jgi:hypothetical protein
MMRLLPMLCLLLAACIDTSTDESSADDSDADAPCIGAACPNDCDHAGDIIVQRYEACDIEVETTDDTEEVECTDALAAQYLCIAACIEVAPCEALAGTDADAALALATCYSECS